MIKVVSSNEANIQKAIGDLDNKDICSVINSLNQKQNAIPQKMKFVTKLAFLLEKIK